MRVFRAPNVALAAGKYLRIVVMSFCTAKPARQNHPGLNGWGAYFFFHPPLHAPTRQKWPKKLREGEWGERGKEGG